jgi:amino acid adenylation domain-containing protein
MLTVYPPEWNNGATLNLPSDRRHNVAISRRTARMKLRWSDSVLNRLRERASESAVSTHALTLASFEVLLHRFCSQDEVTVLAMTRADDAPPSFLGGLVGTLARANFIDDPEFYAVAQKAAAALRGNLVYLEDLQRTNQPPELAKNGTPPIQAAFVYHGDNTPILLFDLGPDRVDPGLEHGLPQADLTLIIQEGTDGLTVGFDYNQDMFSPGMIQEIGFSYRALLTSVAEDLHQCVSRLNLLNPSQRERLLVDWNKTRVPYDRERHVEQLIDAQASRLSDRTALTYRGQSVSYGELRTRSNQLARYLRGMGIGPGKLVALCTDRSPDMVVGLLGVLKAGAAYVPLDPYYPKERLAFMLEDAGCSAVVTQEQWWDCLPETGAPTVSIDTDRSVLNRQKCNDLAAEASPEDLAYVIYTSGSTGKPKGVAIRRCALTNFIHAMRRQFDVCEHDVFLAITTISFDIAGLELFLPLTGGGRVVLATRDDTSQASRLSQLADTEGVTFLQATPATWRMLLDSNWVGRGDLRILCGGEAMSRDLADRLLRKGSALWNMYGPTETTVWSTMCRIESTRGPISVGRPIDNTEIYILDRHLQPVPIGAVGELHIGGIGLAREYLNRPELTAEKFIAHPFSAEPGARIYKTGDLARYWPDGGIECLGRVDHQVKIRGFRVELPEIEACLSAHPGIRQVAVVARDDSFGDKFLAAYYVPHDSAGSTVSADDLRQHVGAVLPRHMVPSVFVSMSSLPLTPNGKIDRRALPAPDRQACEQDKTYVAPQTPLERQLVEIWEDLLETRPIGTRDDFFALGGHSLTAARLVARIEDATGGTLPVSTLLSAPTIERLARVLTGETRRGSGIVVPFRRSGSRPPVFMVAGVGGHVLIFRELAELLGDDQPVYGLQGIGVDGSEAPINCMEDIAARFIREVRSVRSEGPCVIAGWSMGGVIAYEMGVQMVAAGDPPAAIIVMDAYAPWAVSWKDRLRTHLARFRQRSLRSKVEYAIQRVTHRFEVLQRRLGVDNLAEGLDGQTAERVRQSSLAQYEAFRQYRPRPLAADIFLLRAEQTHEIRDPRAEDPQLGWRTLVRGGIHVMPIPGSHTHIFTGSNVRVLAATLSRCLEPVPQESSCLTVGAS